MKKTITYHPGDIVQIKPHVKVGPWPVGGFVCTVEDVISTDHTMGLWLERRNAYDFPILVRADDCTFLRSAEPTDPPMEASAMQHLEEE